MQVRDSKQLDERASGFTIVELLIVIVIIGILASLVIVAYTGIQNRANETKNQTNAQAVLKKAEAYAADNEGTYPTLAQIDAATGVARLDANLVAVTAATAPAGTDATTKARIQYRNCGTGAGVKINYWKSASSTISGDLLGGDTSGTCT